MVSRLTTSLTSPARSARPPILRQYHRPPLNHVSSDQAPHCNEFIGRRWTNLNSRDHCGMLETKKTWMIRRSENWRRCSLQTHPPLSAWLLQRLKESPRYRSHLSIHVELKMWQYSWRSSRDLPRTMTSSRLFRALPPISF